MRLFTCGFEENDIAASATSMWTSINAGGSAPSLSTTTVRSGTYALRLQGVGGGSQPNVNRTLDAPVTGGTYYTRFYYRFPTLPAANIVLARTANSGGTSEAEIILLTSGKLRLKNAVTGTTADSTTTLAVNTWYRLELRHLVADSGGEMELRIDGGSEASITAEDTLATNLFFFVFGQDGTNHLHDQFYDDIAINDTTGAFQTSWPGDGKIVLVKPASDDAVTWTKAGSVPAATNFGGVDEVPGAPNDGTDYNEDSGTSNEDRLGHNGLPGGVGAGDTMVLLDAYARVQAGAASQTMRLLVWDNGGSQTTGPSIALANGTWAMLTTAEHYPVSLSGKTKANVDAYDLGYEGLTGASAKRISALWANVEYQSVGGGASAIPVFVASYRRRRL